MYALLIYSLKVGVCLAVFYLFFKLCMARETLHRLNRVLILSAVTLSFVLPVAVVTLHREVPMVVAQEVSLPVIADVVETVPQEWDWRAALGGLFLLGAVVMFVRMVWALAEVAKVIRAGRRETLPDGAVLVSVPFATTPFSWGRYIVISEEDIARCGEVIITHERAHCRLHHTVDLIFMDVVGVLQWFNPAMWLLKRDLRDIHEYEADAAVLRSGVNAREYQLLLIKKAVGGRWYSVANCFNHSKLKNRITMMLQKKSSKWAGVKALLLLPLVGCAIGAFAETVDVPVWDKGTQNLSITAENCRLTVVVIDSEHQPVIGAEVSCGKNGGVTDKKGEVSLTVPQGETVVVKCAGYKTMELQAPQHKMATMVAKMEAGELAGKVSAVTVGDEKPLIVVDDKVMGKDYDLSKIDSQKIASMAVLKGKSATEKYGAQAQGGAIEVKMKSAKSESNGMEVSLGEQKIEVYGAQDASSEKGVQTVVISGDSSSSVRTSGSNPLVVVDGKVMGKDFDLSKIDSKQIASMAVLKGKSATEKYGDKAADGAVEITLKQKGQEKKGLVVTYGNKNIEVLNTQDDSFAEVKQPLVIRVNSSIQTPGKRLLVVIDGKVEGRDFDLSKIDSKKIASITVLKGKSATEKYGDEAENGALEVTLKKKGQEKKGLVVTYGNKNIEVLNTQDDSFAEVK